jgi:cell division initiation protein
MALGVSPGRVREIRFAEQWRGYRTDEVDEFVDQVAEAFDQLEARVQECSTRAAEAERRLLERGPDDDLSRTLVLAQRTADAVLHEAEVEAAGVLARGEERARLLVEEAEVRRAHLDQEIEARVASELREVSERRAVLETEVAALTSYVEHQRRRMADELREQLAWLEGSGHLELPPTPASSAVIGSTAGAPPEDEVALDLALPAEEWRRSDPESESDLGESDAGDSDAGESDAGANDPDDRGGPVEAQSERAAAGDGLSSKVRASWPADPNDDPFLAELRRAADDPEPLGPRESAPADEWHDEHDPYRDTTAGTGRFRRRRSR